MLYWCSCLLRHASIVDLELDVLFYVRWLERFFNGCVLWLRKSMLWFFILSTKNIYKFKMYNPIISLKNGNKNNSAWASSHPALDRWAVVAPLVRTSSSTPQSPAVQSRRRGRAPLQLHHLCFSGETVQPQEPLRVEDVHLGSPTWRYACHC